MDEELRNKLVKRIEFKISEKFFEKHKITVNDILKHGNGIECLTDLSGPMRLAGSYEAVKNLQCFLSELARKNFKVEEGLTDGDKSNDTADKNRNNKNHNMNKKVDSNVKQSASDANVNDVVHGVVGGMADAGKEVVEKQKVVSHGTVELEGKSKDEAVGGDGKNEDGNLDMNSDGEKDYNNRRNGCSSEFEGKHTDASVVINHKHSDDDDKNTSIESKNGDNDSGNGGGDNDSGNGGGDNSSDKSEDGDNNDGGYGHKEKDDDTNLQKTFSVRNHDSYHAINGLSPRDENDKYYRTLPSTVSENTVEMNLSDKLECDDSESSFSTMKHLRSIQSLDDTLMMRNIEQAKNPVDKIYSSDYRAAKKKRTGDSIDESYDVPTRNSFDDDENLVQKKLEDSSENNFQPESAVTFSFDKFNTFISIAATTVIFAAAITTLASTTVAILTPTTTTPPISLDINIPFDTRDSMHKKTSVAVLQHPQKPILECKYPGHTQPVNNKNIPTSDATDTSSISKQHQADTSTSQIATSDFNEEQISINREDKFHEEQISTQYNIEENKNTNTDNIEQHVNVHGKTIIKKAHDDDDKKEISVLHQNEMCYHNDDNEFNRSTAGGGSNNYKQPSSTVYISGSLDDPLNGDPDKQERGLSKHNEKPNENLNEKPNENLNGGVVVNQEPIRMSTKDWSFNILRRPPLSSSRKQPNLLNNSNSSFARTKSSDLMDSSHSASLSQSQTAPFDQNLEIESMINQFESCSLTQDSKNEKNTVINQQPGYPDDLKNKKIDPLKPYNPESDDNIERDNPLTSSPEKDTSHQDNKKRKPLPTTETNDD